jgi:CBS domain-containing protein
MARSLHHRHRIFERETTMTVREVMTKRIATCRPETNLAEAIALMWENDCGVLPVIDGMGELAGIVTDRDLCIALGTRNVRPSELCVRDVFKNHTLVCKSSDAIYTALRTMSHGKVRRLPVVGDDGSLEGVVSIDDVVLNADSGDGRMGLTISYGDAITTLQAIYTCDRDFYGHAAAA